MPRTWRAGGIIGPTTAKTENAGAGGGEAVRDKTAGRVEDFPDRSLQQEPEVLEKLIKLVEKWTELLIILQKETNFLRDAGAGGVEVAC